MLIVEEDYVTGVLQPQGVEVTVEHIESAETVIALKIGAILDDAFDMSLFSRGDRHWLRQAVIYEAAWLKGHPDVFQRINTRLITTDDDSIHIEDDGLLLAPLARWALMRTSMMKATGADIEAVTIGPTGDAYRVATDQRYLDDVGWHPWK